MEINPDSLEVTNNIIQNRFEVSLEGRTAIMEYMIAGTNMIFTHTEVPPEFEGKGIASRMAQFALDYARDHSYKIQALCPFVALYIRRHPEYQPITWGYE